VLAGTIRNHSFDEVTGSNQVAGLACMVGVAGIATDGVAALAMAGVDALACTAGVAAVTGDHSGANLDQS